MRTSNPLTRRRRELEAALATSQEELELANEQLVNLAASHEARLAQAARLEEKLRTRYYRALQALEAYRQPTPNKRDGTESDSRYHAWSARVDLLTHCTTGSGVPITRFMVADTHDRLGVTVHDRPDTR